MQQMMERELEQGGQNKDEEEAYKVKKKTHDLLPNADENMRKLKVRKERETEREDEEREGRQRGKSGKCRIKYSVYCTTGFEEKCFQSVGLY